MQIGPHTLSRGPIVSSKYESTSPDQVVARAPNGEYVVTEGLYPASRTWDWRFRLPRDEAERIIAYLEQSARFAAEVITVTENSVARQMRFTGGKIRVTYRGAAFAEFNLTFTEEVSV